MTEQPSAGPPASLHVTIIVNGREKSVPGTRLTFRQVITLAFDPIPTGEFIEFTVTYRNGPPANPKGSMVLGDSVEISRGMVFNVTATDKS